jgi:hypothetical protein
MDMTTALDYSEDYTDPEADIWVYSAAASPLPKPEGKKGLDGYLEYLKRCVKVGPTARASRIRPSTRTRWAGSSPALAVKKSLNFCLTESGAKWAQSRMHT